MVITQVIYWTGRIQDFRKGVVLGKIGDCEAWACNGVWAFAPNGIHGKCLWWGKLFNLRMTNSGKFAPFLLILGKWQTSHESTCIVGLTEKSHRGARPSGDLQDPDWQGKIKSHNILPAVSTATEFSLGTDRRVEGVHPNPRNFPGPAHVGDASRCHLQLTSVE